MSARSGEAISCFTTDLDAAPHGDINLDDYLNEPAIPLTFRSRDLHVERGLLT